MWYKIIRVGYTVFENRFLIGFIGKHSDSVMTAIFYAIFQERKANEIFSKKFKKPLDN